MRLASSDASPGTTSPSGAARSANARGPSYWLGHDNLTPAANPTDVFAVLQQGIHKTIFVERIVITATADVVATLDLRVQRSAEGGGGTSAAALGVAKAQLDDYWGNSAIMNVYSANRVTNGNGVDNTRQLFGAAKLAVGRNDGTVQPQPLIISFSGEGRPTIKNGPEWVVVNLLGQALPAGFKISCYFEVSEEALPRVVFAGDSTTSNATTLFHELSRNGGLNAVANFLNAGSNGMRLEDVILNTNGPPYPLVGGNGTIDRLGSQPGVLVLCYGINDLRQGAVSLNELKAMNDTAIHAVLNGTTNNQVYVSPKATVHAISAASWAGGVATITTTAPHGFSTNTTAKVNIAGMTPAGYNGYYAITVTGPSSFTYPLAGDPGAATVMGTATYAMKFSATIAAKPDTQIILWSANTLTTDGNTGGTLVTLTGRFASGFTLAQAAQTVSNDLYSATEEFRGDRRVFQIVHQRDLFGPVSGTIANSGAYLFGLGTLRVNAPLMTDILHPNARGQQIQARQIKRPVLRAVQRCQDIMNGEAYN